MAAKNVILALLALCSFAYGQTRALFVTTNGTVQWGTTLRFDGPLDFTTNEFAATTRSNLSLGLPALTNSSNAGLLSALGGLATNGSAAGLTNFPALLLTTNSSESAFPATLLRTNGSALGLSSFPAVVLQTNSSLSAFPQGLLRTNGDGGGLTNLPNANLSNAIGVLPVSNGGTGSTNTSNARTALGLGTAATNPASAFQPASTALTNLAAGDASGLTNLPNANLGTATGVLGIANGGSGATNAAEARTNFGLVWGGLTNVDAAGFRLALSLGTAATNDASAFQPASANLTNLAANNGGSLTNISVDLTAVLPSYSNNVGKVLAVASGATNVEWTAISNTVTDASTLTNFPAIILQTNSADGSFPVFLLRTNGSANALTNFPTIVLQTNSSDSAFPQALLRTNGNGGALTNLTAANVIGTVALASNVTGTVALATNVTGTVAIANGGTGASDVTNARVNLLPSYTGNSSRVLALNSNATEIVWAVDGGGTANLTNVTNTLGIGNGGTGSNSVNGALTSLGIYSTNASQAGVKLGIGNAVSSYAVALGADADSFSDYGVAIGADTDVTDSFAGVAIGAGADALANASISIGWLSYSLGAESIVIGRQGIISTNATEAIAIGRSSIVRTNAAFSIAIGSNAGISNNTTNAIAIGYTASAGANNAVQIGDGDNTNASTIQFLSAGVVDTTEWSALANASSQGRYVMTNTAGISGSKTFVAYDGTNYTTNTVTFSNGIITDWTP